MPKYDTVKDDASLNRAAEALTANGFTVRIVANGEEAKQAALKLLPKGEEVLTVTSRTLDQTGLTPAINESGDYDAVRPKLNALMGDPSKKEQQRKLGAAPTHVIGSVHALTEDGRVLIASNTGSQLPAYLYGAGHVVWVVGGQKITKDMDDALNRLEQHVVPLENERSKQAYGAPTNVSKLAMVNKEIQPGRIDIIIAKEALGF
ncbi:MAG TPA: LUD domain-containing protein [Candidatus Saccharimonadales bacterium]